MVLPIRDVICWGYNMRYLLIIIAILSVGLGWYIFKDNLNQNKITSLETEKNELSAQVKSMENEIERYNEKQLQASSTIEKVREVIKTVKEPCDCYNTALPDDIKRLLHENNN